MHPKPIDLAVTAPADARPAARGCKRRFIAPDAMPFVAPPRALSEAPDRGALTFIGPSRALPACLIPLAVACRERLATTDAFHHA